MFGTELTHRPAAEPPPREPLPPLPTPPTLPPPTPLTLTPPLPLPLLLPPLGLSGVPEELVKPSPLAAVPVTAIAAVDDDVAAVEPKTLPEREEAVELVKLGRIALGAIAPLRPD